MNNHEEVDKRYPLCWPAGWKRTRFRRRSQFKVSEAKARDEMINEVELLGGTGLIISTNVRLRQDGLPYTKQPGVTDPGVAVYFRLNGKPVAMACDQYERVWENMRALGKAVECLRGIKRYGASDLLERAFMGFQQLAYTPEPEWWQVLGVESHARDIEVIRERYLKLAKQAHPDHGGDEEQMKRVNAAMAKARELCGGMKMVG